MSYPDAETVPVPDTRPPGNITWLPPVKTADELPPPDDRKDHAAYHLTDDPSAGSFVFICDGEKWNRVEVATYVLPPSINISDLPTNAEQRVQMAQELWKMFQGEIRKLGVSVQVFNSPNDWVETDFRQMVAWLIRKGNGPELEPTFTA